MKRNTSVIDVQLIRDYLHIVTLSILSSKYRRPEKQNLSHKYLPVSHFCNPIYRFYKLNALKDFNLFQLLCINWQRGLTHGQNKNHHLNDHSSQK